MAGIPAPSLSEEPQATALPAEHGMSLATSLAPPPSLLKGTVAQSRGLSIAISGLGGANSLQTNQSRRATSPNGSKI